MNKIHDSTTLIENLSEKESENSPSSEMNIGEEKSSQQVVSKTTGNYRRGQYVSGKASRNKIFRERIELEDALNDHKSTYMHEVLQKAIELALNGNVPMIKLLLETSMSKAAPIEDTTEGKDKIQVTIRKLVVDEGLATKDGDKSKPQEEIKLNG